MIEFPIPKQVGIETDGEMVRAFIELLSRAAESRVPLEEEPSNSGWSNDVAVTTQQLNAAVIPLQLHYCIT